jgi:signal transduction histidine kinase
MAAGFPARASGFRFWRHVEIRLSVADVPSTYPKVRWHNSLIFRIVLLCMVLLLCLLGLVYEMTLHYLHGAVREMDLQTQDIASRVTLILEQHSAADLNEIEHNLSTAYDGTRIRLNPNTGSVAVSKFTIEPGEDGRLAKVAHVPITLPDQQFLLTVEVPIVPLTEIVHAFGNKYLAALTVIFVVTLGLMIYFIARILRPITELSKTCAEIGSGKLLDVATRKNTGEILTLEYTFNKMVASLREKEVVEANLRQAQRLSAIGNLAAGVAHDVRNPLNAIKLLSGHAIDTLGGVAEAGPAVKQLQTIRSEVNRLEEIVSGFLSLAKERELRQEPYRIDLLLEECARLVRKDAEARGVRLVTELRAGELSLMVDPKQMTRAILNVVINGMEACPKGGRVRLFSRVTDQACEIEIRDDGPGIPKEAAERAFDPYFTTKPTGTGLGLAITRGIVEEHGGTITLTGSEDQGCQVLITLPLKAKQG